MKPRMANSIGKRREEGSAIFVMVMVMGLVLVLMVANARVVAQLGRQIRALETRQQKHWTSLAPAGQPPAQPVEKSN